jgi:hypothetical protein
VEVSCSVDRRRSISSSMRRADLKIGLCQVGKLNSWALVRRWIRCPETQSELHESVVEESLQDVVVGCGVTSGGISCTIVVCGVAFGCTSCTIPAIDASGCTTAGAGASSLSGRCSNRLQNQKESATSPSKTPISQTPKKQKSLTSAPPLPPQPQPSASSPFLNTQLSFPRRSQNLAASSPARESSSPADF